jgi:hypothetical protein
MDAGRMVLEDKRSDIKSTPFTSDKGAQVLVKSISGLHSRESTGRDKKIYFLNIKSNKTHKVDYI